MLLRYFQKLAQVLGVIAAVAAFVGAMGYFLVPAEETISGEGIVDASPKQLYGMLNNASYLGLMRPSVIRVVAHGEQNGRAVWTEFSRTGDVSTFITDELVPEKRVVTHSLMPNRLWSGRRIYELSEVSPEKTQGKMQTRVKITEENRILNPFLRLARFLSVDRSGAIRHSLAALRLSASRA